MGFHGILQGLQLQEDVDSALFGSPLRIHDQRWQDHFLDRVMSIDPSSPITVCIVSLLLTITSRWTIDSITSSIYY